MKYAIFYTGPNGPHQCGEDRFDTPDEAEQRRKRCFQPSNWSVVSVETKEVITPLVAKTTTAWVPA